MKQFLTAMLYVTVILAFTGSNGFSQENARANWYRGNVHMHSFWSDGNVYPEQAVDWYKENGYHFVILSDHTELQINPQRWINVGEGHWIPLYEKYIEKYGPAETREVDGRKQIRLLTVHELKEKLDIPGRFLMIPGHEMNSSTNGVTLHGIAMNVTETIPFHLGETLAEAIDKNARAVRKNGEDHGHISDFLLNHPIWPYYDIDPLSMVNAKDTRMYEFLCANGGPSEGYDESDRFWNRESLWDIVTAFRIVKGYPLMFGFGTDDTHDYTNFRDRGDNPGQSWVVVRAEKLEPDCIIHALRQGDFYTSNGVEMEDIAFDRKTGTLSVRVKPVAGVNYRIQFIGTKKEFDQTVEPFEMEKTEKNPARKGWSFSKEIGIELLSVDGIEASYRLNEDDLYVRAIISSDQPKEIHAGLTPNVSTAWTQPFTK
ncbi:MAG: hypothetical protein FWH27_04465 [Planctomycetaceae bacterium]|nr:hypothetical protein [Planctomycetaceae bacterium]